MIIAVIGANGQLGYDIAYELQSEHTVISLYHETFDLTKFAQMQHFFLQNSVDCVINAAALTDVEFCEKDPFAAYAVNALGVRDVARFSQRAKAYFIHISCAGIFDGSSAIPYTEHDRPHPLSVYANTKVAGEYYALAECERATVVRTSFLYGKHCPNKKNAVDSLLEESKEKPELYVPDDIIFSPTSTVSFARQIHDIVNNPIPGIVHASCKGNCTWYQFALRMMALSSSITPVLPAKPGDRPVREPVFSSLENSVLKRLKRDLMPFWEDALNDYLHDPLSNSIPEMSETALPGNGPQQTL